MAGQRLEAKLKVRGQFSSRPHGVLRRVNEPFASAIIYPGCVAAWVFLALYYSLELWAGLVAIAVLVAGFAATLRGARLIGMNQQRDDAVLDAIRAQGPISAKDLRGVRGLDEDWLMDAVRRLKRQTDVVEHKDGLVIST